MKRWIGLSLLLVPLLAGAASFWDGNAALQRGDAAFEAGSFAASNSFPTDTRIQIQNLDTGKTTEATVTKRIDSQSDILVLVSPPAAAALGITQGTMASVRVTVIPPQQPAAVTKPGEQVYSSDPDVNPGAAYGGPTAETPQPTESPQTAETPQATETPVATAPSQTETAQPPVEVPQPAQDQSPQAEEAQRQAEDAAIIADAQSRAPQKELFLPPREDQKFAYKPNAPEATPAVPTPATTEPGGLTEAPAPQEASPQEIVGTESSPPPAATGASGNAPLPEAPKPKTDVSNPTPTPPNTAQPRTALVVPEPPPAQKPPAQHPKTPAPTPPKPAALPRSPKTGSFYLQLAAYGTEKGAQDLAATLAPTYPALIVSPAQDAARQVFRVVIGPLNKAESGTLLTWFRYRGFPDAFLKQE
jgi:hypothetical protein